MWVALAAGAAPLVVSLPLILHGMRSWKPHGDLNVHLTTYFTFYWAEFRFCYGFVIPAVLLLAVWFLGGGRKEKPNDTSEPARRAIIPDYEWIAVSRTAADSCRRDLDRSECATARFRASLCRAGRSRIRAAGFVSRGAFLRSAVSPRTAVPARGARAVPLHHGSPEACQNSVSQDARVAAAASKRPRRGGSLSLPTCRCGITLPIR